MGRISRSIELAKASWTVLRGHPQLSLFPLISGVVSLVVMASFAIPGFFVFQSMEHNQKGPLQYAFMFAFYLVTYFVVIFFNAGLVTCANEVLEGRPATFKDGMRNAFSHIGPIFVYALIASTVGMILRSVSEKAGVVGRIAMSLLGMAWTLITYFVVPILVVENKSPIQAIKESGAMLKRTWGENIAVNASLSLIFGLFSIVALVPMVAGFVLLAAGTVGVAVGIAMIVASILAIIALSLVSSALTGIFQTSLYIYARTGQLPAPYSPDVIQHAFKQQRDRGYNADRW